MNHVKYCLVSALLASGCMDNRSDASAKEEIGPADKELAGRVLFRGIESAYTSWFNYKLAIDQRLPDGTCPKQELTSLLEDGSCETLGEGSDGTDADCDGIFANATVNIDCQVTGGGTDQARVGTRIMVDSASS